MTRNTHQIQRLVHVPPLGGYSLAPAQALHQERGIVNSPAVDGHMINSDAALGHDLL